MPNLDQVWDAFEKKGKSTQSQCYMARCIFCDPLGETLLEGRVRTLNSNAEDEEENQNCKINITNGRVEHIFSMLSVLIINSCFENYALNK